MANALAVEPHASAAETASGSATAVDIGALRSCLKLRLDLTALSGTTPKLTVYVETASASSGPWKSLGSFPALTVTATKDAVFADCLRYNRVRWVLDGATPEAIFAVTGNAHVLYAKVADLGEHGVAKAALANISDSDKAKHCLAATDEADGYLAGGKTLPLTAWSDDLTSKVAEIAAYKALKVRGFQPESSDELIVKGRDDAISWLKGIARGEIDPPGLVDSTPEVYESGISVYSNAPTNSGGSYWP
jgi:phage gp36-like protein